MIQRTLKEIQKMAGGEGLAAQYEEVSIAGVSTDSRSVKNGSLFVPITGENFNGHRFAEKALSEGAAAILWAKKELNPPSDAPVIFVDDTLSALQTLAKSYKEQLNVKVAGVTGSNGKTTTKDLLASALSASFKVHKTQGNFNNHIGLPLTLLSMPEDTEVAVLEMGMSAKGEIEFLSTLARPDAAIITNIGESHLMDLGSREGIADAKLEIASGLKEDGVLFYFGDEPLLEERVPALKRKTVTFGDTDKNDLYPSDVVQSDTGVTFTVQPGGEAFSIPVLGKHNVWNALAAIAAARRFGLTDDAIRSGLSNLAMTAMRLELSKCSKGWSVINDAYNASPTSMKAAIKLTEDLDGYSRKILILGDMLELGDREAEFHEETGEVITMGKTDLVFTYGRLGEWIAKGAKKNLPADQVASFTDKQELIAAVKKAAKPGDLFLVKASRGMRLEEAVEALKQD
ncbi:UDP-N-acetylmuramoyl-tripeptide--D-alanyl-D-alanine ligase [Bacillus sp. FJAT-42376]|uniref:UDP-N-acetylmuramoyl-tripeptide--D-alanyl-D- alanine ligase n=1 Tax=Bacillus sp. FJAT-42376 TaxID=2014076 RepID=UPI000F50163A|nr:UDP-N-acetylmuramoyl-tripeptide--D-alanyl-D-alanine ligase [Bacillus sp. FJAT-42376]AZB41372.1 UDP-N-acetylmuramoyl-tripeptide--D-alanyl-D-alanine ligase [Bacillus sp. FJAT-42376]